MIGGLSYAAVGGTAGAVAGGASTGDWGFTGAAGAGAGFAVGFFVSLVMFIMLIHHSEASDPEEPLF